MARGKRAEAKQALLDNALFLETYYTTRGFYATARTAIPPPPCRHAGAEHRHGQLHHRGGGHEHQLR